MGRAAGTEWRSIELIATSENSDLYNREADIALRFKRPSHPRLIAKRLADARTRLYATRGYLSQLRRRKLGLDAAHFLGFDRDDIFARDLRKLGLSLTRENFPVVSPSHLVQWELAKRGGGICLMLERVGDNEKGMCRAMGDAAVLHAPTYLACHRELRNTRRLRVVFDALVDAFGTH